MPNQMIALMELAWERCQNGIYGVYNLLIGAAIGIAFVILFSGIHFVEYISAYPDVLHETIFPSLGSVLLYSIEFGLVNAVSTILFLATVVCLAEYGGNFVYVCYYYDNCSWEIPKQIRNIILIIAARFRQSRDYNMKISCQHRMELLNQINKIKNSNTEL